MAATPCSNDQVEDEEEYVLLDLDSVPVAHIPPNAPYVLSIGEYEETIGTCFVFSEGDASHVSDEELGTSEPAKEVKPIARLHKILKFKLVSEDAT